jgi:hypothetical protein
MDDIDIRRSAKLYIDQYGPGASIHAAMEMDATLERGDLDRVPVWRRVVRAIDKLQAAADGSKH